MKDIDLKAPGWRLIYSDESAPLIFSEIQNALKAEKNDNLRVFKTTTGRRRIYFFTSSSSEKFLIKAYLPPKFLRRIKYLFRNSRCKDEFFCSKKLAEFNIPSVKAIAFGYRSRFLLPAEELVIEPYIEDHKSFDRLWKESEPEDKRMLFKSFAQLVAKMHSKGVFQRDFKPDSVLAKKSEKGIDLILSDLERIKIHRAPLSLKKRINNLGKIIQAFFRLEHYEEMQWLIEDYSKESKIPFNQPHMKSRIIQSAKKHLLNQAKHRRSWAYSTNELIEKFEIAQMEIRLSRIIGKKEFEKFLEKNTIPEKGQIEIKGQRIELIKTKSAKEQMERFFYLRELRIKCRPVILAIDFKNKRGGIFGLKISETEKPYYKIINELSEEERDKLLRAYEEFTERMDFFNINYGKNPEKKILVQKSVSTYDIYLSSPEQIAL